MKTDHFTQFNCVSGHVDAYPFLIMITFRYRCVFGCHCRLLVSTSSRTHQRPAAGTHTHTIRLCPLVQMRINCVTWPPHSISEMIGLNCARWWLCCVRETRMSFIRLASTAVDEFSAFISTTCVFGLVNAHFGRQPQQQQQPIKERQINCACNV